MIVGFDSRDPLSESFHSLTLSCKEAFVNQLPVSSLSHYFLYLSYDARIEIAPILQKRKLGLGGSQGTSRATSPHKWQGQDLNLGHLLPGSGLITHSTASPLPLRAPLYKPLETDCWCSPWYI